MTLVVEYWGGCDTFSPKRIWSPDIWSPTMGPQLIGPSGQTVPNQFGPHGQMVPKNVVPIDKCVIYDVLDRSSLW